MTPELRELVDKYVSGTLSPGERDRLDAVLLEDPDARAFYVEYLDLHAQLQWDLRAGRPGPRPLDAPRTVPAGRRAAWIGTAAALLMFSALLLFLVAGPGDAGGPGITEATARAAMETEAEAGGREEAGAVLRLPPPEKRKGWFIPYNDSRHDTVHVVPAPGTVAIDGDLSDWDLSGRFTARAADPYGEVYFLRGALMYDARALYVGAFVSDPFPLRSRVDPRTEPEMGWRGGSLQLRLSTDPALGWPLPSEQPELPGRAPGVGSRPVDVSDRLVHATMWYFQPRRQACLHLAHGMDFHGNRANPTGFEGAFRRAPDGRGYTLEYALPWSLLGGRAPRAGETTACAWVLNWADVDGREWHGQLTEITNPSERGKRGHEGATYSRGATWGKAVFHATGNLPPGTVRPR